MINDATISVIEVLNIREGCEKVVAKYTRPANCQDIRREGIFDVLNEVDCEFRKLDFFERDHFRVRVVGVE